MSLPDLRGLDALTEVELLLVEKLDGPQDLAGLERLSWSELGIYECGNLKTLRGLSIKSHVDRVSLAKNPQLVDITALETLHSARALGIGELPVHDLSGLSGLTSVEESLSVTSCFNLGDLNGLNTIATWGAINIGGNLRLRTTEGLRLSGRPWLDLHQNADLREVVIGVEPGFEGFRELRVPRSPKFTSLWGLGQVASIGKLSVSDADRLADLKDLEGLTELNAILLDRNDALTSLKGLGNVRSRLEHLSLIENRKLTSLRALELMPAAADLFIASNESLPQCEVTWLEDRWDVANSGTGNLGTCP